MINLFILCLFRVVKGKPEHNEERFFYWTFGGDDEDLKRLREQKNKMEIRILEL